MNKKWKGFSPYKILGIILGNVIFAFGLAAFSIPNNFLVGGGTGVSRVLEHRSEEHTSELQSHLGNS